MTKRIDTLRNLRQRRDYAQQQLDEGRLRHGLTLADLRRLAALDAEVAELERNIDHYGNEWAKDDWPHAIHARALAVGALADKKAMS